MVRIEFLLKRLCSRTSMSGALGLACQIDFGRAMARRRHDSASDRVPLAAPFTPWMAMQLRTVTIVYWQFG